MLRRLCVILILACAFAVPAFAGIPLASSLAPMLQHVMPAIVNIKARIKITDFATLQQLEKENSANNNSNSSSGSSSDNSSNNPSSNSSQNSVQQPLPDSYTSLGSGVILNAKTGYIVTNAHVIENAETIVVTLGDGRHYTAKVIGIDKPSDIALVQIKADNLTALPVGDSNKVKVGDIVAAIGNPFGLNQTVTSGIVSALGRTTLGIENFENFIQTDAPINPGNSGGALIDMQGELIGINTAILAPDRGSVGIGFAIPANMMKSVVSQLSEYGDVKRGLLGVGAQDITPELESAFHLPSPNGAVVSEVLPDSPAAKGGIEVGDIITEVNNTPVKNASDVINTIGFLRVNSKATVTFLRHNKSIIASVTLTDPKEREQAIQDRDPFLYGVTLKNFTIFSPLYGNIAGVLVIAVAQDTNAWHADLRQGDVILSVNQQKVTNVDQLKAQVNATSKTLLLNVLRGPAAIFLVVSKE